MYDVGDGFPSKPCRWHVSLDDPRKLSEWEHYCVQRSWTGINQYTTKTEELLARVITKRISIETFEIDVSNTDVCTSCSERAGSEVVVGMRRGKRGMSLRV